MRPLFRYLLPLYLCTAWAMPCSLYGQYAATRLYTVQDGLPQTECQMVFVDRSGRLYIGGHNSDRVWTFDGQRFAPGPRLGQVTRMVQDGAGNLWGTGENQLAYHGKDTSLMWISDPTILPADHLPAGVPAPQLHSILQQGEEPKFYAFDKEKTVLYAFDSKNRHLTAIDRVEGSSKTWYLYAEPTRRRYVLAQRQEDRLSYWLKENDSLHHIVTFSLTQVQSPNGSFLYDIESDGDLQVVLSGRLYRWSLQERNLQPIPHTPYLPDLMLTGHPIKSVSAPDFHLKLFEKGNIKYIVENTPDFSHYTITRFYHPGNVISITKDRAGTYWVAGHSGLLRVFPAFTNFFHDANPALLTDLHTLGEDAQDNMWVGSFGQGLGYFRPDDSFVRSSSPFTNLLPGAIATEGGDLLFTGSHNASGILRIKDLQPEIVYPGLQGYYFTRDNAGRILFGSNNRGLFIHEAGSAGFGPESWTSVDPEKGLKLINVLTVLQDEQGRYWMGRPSRGMAVYLPERDTIYNFLKEEAQIDFGLWSSIRDKRGNIWLGTTQGLMRFSPPDTISGDTDLRTYLEPVNRAILDTAEIRGMALYRDRYLVLAADAYFAMLDLPSYYQDPAQPITYLFTEENGYQGLAGEQNAIWIDRRERIWMVNDKGVTRFHPDRFVADTLPIRVAIEQVSSYGDEFTVNERAILSLEQKHTNLRFTIKLLDNPTLAPHIRFLYRLNEDSLRWTDQHTVELLNQPYGKHRFEVIAVKNGVRSQPVSLAFVIPAPFTRTRWFILLIAVALALMAVVAYLLKRRQEKRRRELTLLQAQTIVNQLNPHFINNALGWVQYRADRQQDEDAVAVIQKMAINIKTIFRNSRQKKPHHPLSAELQIVENYFHIQQARFGPDLQYEMPDARQLRGIDLSIHVPLMILQIHCENAVEHGIRNQDSGYVRLSLEDHQDHLRIVIEDNGVGRRRAAKIGSLGSGQGTTMINELIRVFNEHNCSKIRQYFEDDIFTKPDGTTHGTRSVILIPKDYQYDVTAF